MENAGNEFAGFVSELSLNDAKVPVYTNVDANATISSSDFVEKMPKQIYSSVHWTQTIENMAGEGVDTIIEIGPGKVLSGLVKKINSDIKTYNIYDKESLENTLSALKEQLTSV